jgi:hypothetical protein
VDTKRLCLEGKKIYFVYLMGGRQNPITGRENPTWGVLSPKNFFSKFRIAQYRITLNTFNLNIKKKNKFIYRMSYKQMFLDHYCRFY